MNKKLEEPVEAVSGGTRQIIYYNIIFEKLFGNKKQNGGFVYSWQRKARFLLWFILLLFVTGNVVQIS